MSISCKYLLNTVTVCCLGSEMYRNIVLAEFSYVNACSTGACL